MFSSLLSVMNLAALSHLCFYTKFIALSTNHKSSHVISRSVCGSGSGRVIQSQRSNYCTIFRQSDDDSIIQSMSLSVI
jgi:hypothetical protein